MFAQTTYDPSLLYTGTLVYGANDASINLTRTSVASAALDVVTPDVMSARTAGNIETALTQADSWAKSGESGHSEFQVFEQGPDVARSGYANGSYEASGALVGLSTTLDESGRIKRRENSSSL
jgi:hypothetical protein